MTTESKIKEIVENHIPLDPKCAVKRSEQMAQRAGLRLDLEYLFREVAKPYDPRTELKRDNPSTFMGGPPFPTF